MHVQNLNLSRLYYIWERKARKDSLQFSVKIKEEIIDRIY